jgi:hypothetical protein
MTNPYSDLPPDRFWRSAVAQVAPLDIAGLWHPKFRITRRTRIITAGSCFAQHFARALAARGYRWQDHEPGPPGLTAGQRHDYHYGTFSFRTGNIYTPRMLRQWLTWALTDSPAPDEVWEAGGRFHDPLRPLIEPEGFVSVAELLAARQVTLQAIRKAVEAAQLFVFTLGLTESWQNRETGLEYALCPGTGAGRFDAGRHVFVNHGFAALTADMQAVLKLLAQANPRLLVLLTVSPVPLTATASGQHVLTATSHSKSLLRAVAGELAATLPQVDYFPSYEIITHPVYRGRFYAPNLRSVLAEGVEHVMTSFFRDQAAAFGGAIPPVMPVSAPSEAAPAPEAELSDADALRCEEELLAAFAPDPAPEP